MYKLLFVSNILPCLPFILPAFLQHVFPCPSSMSFKNQPETPRISPFPTSLPDLELPPVS